MLRFAVVSVKLILIVTLLTTLSACGAPRAQSPAPSPPSPSTPTRLPTTGPATAESPTATRPSAAPTPPAATALPTHVATTTAGATATTQRPAATAAPAPAATVALPGGSPSGVKPLVTYEKSGGLKGVRDTLVVYDDGRVELTNRAGAKKTGQVAPDVVSSLKQRIALVDWPRLKPRYQVPGADMFSYAVTVTLPNGAAASVVTMDNAQHPDTLSDVLRSLEEIARQTQ